MRKTLILLFLIFSSTASTLLAQSKPASDGIYGFCEHTTHDNYQFYQQTSIYPVMQNSGINMIRTDIVWPWNRDEQNGIWWFQNLDKVVAQMHDAGMGFLPILTGAPESACPLHENLSRWDEFVKTFVSRYKGQCPYWEICNEHNFPHNYWGIGDSWETLNTTHARNYATVLESAYRTIKNIDPKLQVVYGGTSGVPIPYIEATLKEGAGNSFDVMNVHPYSWASNPEDYLRTSIWELKKLMAKYNINKPIWATEIGWSTATQPENLYYKQVLSLAFGKLNMDTKSIPIVFIDEAISYKHNFVKEFPQFKEVVTIPIEKLKSLDPQKYPVLVPTKGEYFKYYYAQDLIDYVKKGGTIILPESLPFYYDVPVYDAEGNVQKPPYDYAYSICDALHFSTQGWFMTGNTIEIPGVDRSQIRHFENVRFVQNRNLRPGDTYTPLAYATNGEQRAEIAALINLNSDLKGNVIVCTQLDDKRLELVTVSEEAQAQIIQRAHLLLFAEGVQKVFWYKFSDLANALPDASNIEENFGIVKRNMQPKPAYQSYKVLTEMYPNGSGIPNITKNSDGLYVAEWERPDNTKVYGVWTSHGSIGFSSDLIEGKVVKITDYIGNSLGELATQYTATPGITFFVCKGATRATTDNTKGDKDAFIVNIYPIPTSGNFTLELPELIGNETGNIRVYNQQGILVAQKNNVLAIQDFDISSLSNGYYNVRISVNNKIVTKKIIKN